MKIITLTLICVILFSTVVNAEINPILKLLFNSAIETDRYQSYYWHFATPENPVAIWEYEKDGIVLAGSNKGYITTYEKNVLVRTPSREEFNSKVDITKKLINNIDKIIKNNYLANIVYGAITIIEIGVIINNNERKFSDNSNTSLIPQVWMLSYGFEF